VPAARSVVSCRLVAFGAGEPAHVVVAGIANAAADVWPCESGRLPTQEKKINAPAVARDRAVRIIGRESGRVRPGSIGHRNDLCRLNNVGNASLLRKVPGAEIHVHAVRQKVIAAGIGGDRTDEWRIGALPELVIVCE